MHILSSLIRFNVSTSTPFHSLRQTLARAGVTSQFFGATLPDVGTPRTHSDGEMLWVIQWPAQPSPQIIDIATALPSQLPAGATTVQLQLEAKTLEEIERALSAPVCQFAVIGLSPTTPLPLTSWVEDSMRKTFTDCYLSPFPGFKGGSWGYAFNGDDARGERLEDELEGLCFAKQRSQGRLAFYYLGWDSLEAHSNYALTPLMALEIDKLAPFFGDGTGAWYGRLEKHQNQEVPH